MGIEQIRIRNYKSLQNIILNFDRDKHDIQCIIGKNGTGKSSILDAIEFFYKMLSNNYSSVEQNIDNNNRYVQKMQIEFIYNFDMKQKINSNDYLDNIIKTLKPYIVNNRMQLRLTQYKDGTIEWYPQGKDIRKHLSKLFPIYMIDTRFVTLHNWSKIWDIIGELSISNIKKEESEMEKIVDELLDKIYGDKYHKSLHKIETIFSREAVSVNKYNYIERFKSALYTRFGSSEFLSDGNFIDYYSDGTNSLKYIKLVIQLIAFLSETGWKQPLIIIDEPEIGLHPQYIDDLVECINESKHSRVNLLLTTHSTNLVTSLIKHQIKVGLKRVFINSGYTKLESIKNLIDLRDKFLISNAETECYFSNAIMFVEGSSEMQLFQYPRLRELYEFIKYIKFYNCNSNYKSLSLIHPINNKFNVPFILLVDMDKIIKYKYSSKKFILNKEELINPLFNSNVIKAQKFYYYNNTGKKYLTLNYRQHIIKTLKSSNFEQNNNLFWINNKLYKNLYKNINIYCSNFNVHAVTTTIEGCIVNVDNYLIVLEWLNNILKQEEKNKLNTIISQKENIFYKVTILRLVLNGKLDNLLTLKEAKGKLIDNNLYNDINSINFKIGDKTSGWIINFLDYYFEKYIDNLENTKDQLQKFSHDFKELNNILQTSHNMVK